MTFSVWNQAARAFDYYQSPDRSAGASAPPARHLDASSKHGIHPEAAAWPLPSAAKRIGRGARAKGFVASRSPWRASLGALPFDLTGPNLVVVGVVAYLVYDRIWKNKP